MRDFKLLLNGILETRSAKNGLITDAYINRVVLSYDGLIILLSSVWYFHVFQLYLYGECACECNRTIMPRCTCGGESPALWNWFTPSTFGWVVQIGLMSVDFCSK